MNPEFFITISEQLQKSADFNVMIDAIAVHSESTSLVPDVTERASPFHELMHLPHHSGYTDPGSDPCFQHKKPSAESTSVQICPNPVLISLIDPHSCIPVDNHPP
jgi:hypothetical protein